MSFKYHSSKKMGDKCICKVDTTYSHSLRAKLILQIRKRIAGKIHLEAYI